MRLPRLTRVEAGVDPLFRNPLPYIQNADFLEFVIFRQSSIILISCKILLSWFTHFSANFSGLKSMPCKFFRFWVVYPLPAFRAISAMHKSRTGGWFLKYIKTNIEGSSDSGKGGGDLVFTTDVGTCGLLCFCVLQCNWETQLKEV